MATYNFDSTGSTEYLPVNLSASEEIVFHVTNSNEGSSYFTIETYPNNDGGYNRASPKNTSGSFVSSSGITTIVSDDYHMSAVVENGGGTITFSPASDITSNDLKVRGVGGKINYDGILDRWPNASAAYSLRRLNSYYDGPAVKVRRSVDSEEKDINFIGTKLDTTSLTTFTVPTSSVLPSNYGDGASAAYSLRYVSSTYTGPVVKVRRSNDNEELDFTPSQITDGTLETWVGANNGFVTTWYDQSGNGNDAVQATAGAQPQIVSSGTVIKENGKPTLKFDGTDDLLKSDFAAISQPNSYLSVATNTSSPGGYKVLFSGYDDGNQRNQIELESGTNNVRIYAGLAINTSQSLDTNQHLFTSIFNTTNSEVYLDTTLIGSGDAGNYNQKGLTIGARYTDTIPWLGNIQELIMYNSNISSSRTDIESNINNYYDIFDYNAYVTTWYDQSGNGLNATQGTAAYQPIIVSGSQIVLGNDKPTIKFDGTNDFLELNGVFTSNVTSSTFAVVSSNDVTSDGTIYDNTDDISDGGGYHLRFYDGGGFRSWAQSFNSGGVTAGTTSNGVYYLSSRVSNAYVGETNIQYQNGGIAGSASGSATTRDAKSTTRIGNSELLSNTYLDGEIQELVAYDTDQSSGRTFIESDINNHYNLYSSNLVFKVDAGNPLSYPGSGSTWYDLSSYGNNGTLAGGTTFDSSNGGSISFNTSGDYIDFGGPLLPELGLSTLTLICWFNRTGNGATASTGNGGIDAEPLIAKGRGESDQNNRDMNYLLGILPGDKTLAADFERHELGTPNNHPITSSVSLENGKWYQVVASYDGSIWRIYLNGELISSQYIGWTPRFDSLQWFSLGRAQWSTGDGLGWFNGKMSIAEVYNTALSPEAIIQNYNNTKDRYEL